MNRFLVFFLLFTFVTIFALALANTSILHSDNIVPFFIFYFLATLSSAIIALSVKLPKV